VRPNFYDLILSFEGPGLGLKILALTTSLVFFQPAVLRVSNAGVVVIQAVHLLSVRVDSLDRRLVQLETVERRTNELADMNCRLADLSHLQQRVADLEQTLLTTSSDKAVTINGHSTNVDHVGNTVDVVHSVTSNVDALMKQLNNLMARMTLAENQLMLQVPFILYDNIHPVIL